MTFSNTCKQSILVVTVIGVSFIYGCTPDGTTDVEAREPESFQLHVNDVSGLEEPWPLIGGLPFPEGELHDASQIRVVDSGGEEVPAQIDVVATWNDGSIRWAQAGINASPQGEYRVEYGPEVARGEYDMPLEVRKGADGSLVVDTGKAEYEFVPDALLPNRGTIDGTVYIDDSGGGAYLIDNHGRLARVAGESAEIMSEILKEGPGRVVVRREGWYVTEGEDGGEQVARAKMWFYFTAGSPFVRMTHSIVFTEDTNELWVRDYGLELRTPEPPQEAVFALSESTEADRFPPHGGHAGWERDGGEEMFPEMAALWSSGLYEREQTLFPVELEGEGEVYMLQEDYPHVMKRDFHAVIAKTRPTEVLSGANGNTCLGNLWTHRWIKETEVAGDWAEARYDDYAMMVVMPQLAQSFPKEIAIGPEAVRVAFWSGRSGRELDFRAVTLVNEYWRDWAHYVHSARGGFGGLEGVSAGPEAASALAGVRSNAQSAARTHDVWLLPRKEDLAETELKARSLAAAHPPLLQADPQWLGGSMAIGWPMHPKDTDRFPEAEETLEDRWETLLGSLLYNAGFRRAGFIMWGKNITLARTNRMFRVSGGAGHYGLDRSAWQLYMRSGDRPYYDYGRHFSRFSGDLMTHHWTADDRFRGGRADAYTDLPMYWGNNSTLGGGFCTLGWMLEYYLTGDEYANELLQMRADAYREHGADDDLSGHGHLYNLSILYQHTQDEAIRDMARQTAHGLIDLDNPTGLNDNWRYGVYYKISTEWLFPLYLYYNATGDEKARQAILQAVDSKFRFNHEDWTETPDGRGPSSSQTFRLLMFSEAYRWTGNPAYLELVNHMVENPRLGLMGHNFFHGAPAALYVLAHADEPIGPFPVLAVTRDPGHNLQLDHEFVEADSLPPIRFRKESDTPLTLSIYVRMPNDLDEDTAPEPRVFKAGSAGDDAEPAGVKLVKEQDFRTKNAGRRDLRRWHIELTLTEEAEPGDYLIEFPRAATLTVLESDAEEIGFEE